MSYTTTISSAVGAGVMSAIGFLVGVGGADVAGNIIKEPEPYGAQFVELDFQGGKFVQHVRPVNTISLRMKWGAKITRNGEIICSGGGVSTYTDKRVTMTPKVWTGEECPILQVGDVAEASWTYETVNGNNVIISGSKTLDRL